eukprot:TRINITY_DN16268_c0_g1_i1.p1 TRINITY_DN16268_c0_g1~~TRINITY_DN16268_c0_g1_i1.p1  ORF type:complete len:433 (+),score=116.19 TRINITY_DN16268_c0_g1_i1:85-1383(+)
MKGPSEGGRAAGVALVVVTTVLLLAAFRPLGAGGGSSGSGDGSRGGKSISAADLREVIRDELAAYFAAPRPAAPGPPPSARPSASCGPRPAVYSPSAWEVEWTSNIKEWSQGTLGWDQGCSKMRESSGLVKRWLTEAAGSRTADAAHMSSSVFSRLHPPRNCTRPTWIEPIVGHLRDPRWYCGDPLRWLELRQGREAREAMHRDEQKAAPGREWMNRERELQQRVDWLVLPWASQVLEPGGRALLFDVGAKDWGSGSLMQVRGDTSKLPRAESSLQWLWQEFAGRGISFDRVLAWDPDVDPKKLWELFPGRLRPIVSYHPYAVSSDSGSELNPWYFVRQICRVEDFCVVKLDIDASAVELELVKQLLRQDDLHSLVDEFFWEHHVTHHPMLNNQIGWKYQKREIEALGVSIADSYTYFQALRQVGIRAHSWP